ncbi:MAG: MerR family transcriptional regulator [Acidimicrobiales bacterium]
MRALHHYDHLGLVQPSARTPAGYRLYVESDVERLYQVLALRQLGLPLETIGDVLDGTCSTELLLQQQSGGRVDEASRAWMRLLEQFHGGDEGLRASLYRMYADNAEQVEQQRGGSSPALLAFVDASPHRRVSGALNETDRPTPPVRSPIPH